MEMVSIMQYEQRIPVQYVKGMEQLEELVSWQGREKQNCQSLRVICISQQLNNYVKK